MATPELPRPFYNAWFDFLKAVGKAGKSADESLELLSQPLKTAYASEVEFDCALFAALRSCLEDLELPSEDDNTIILDAKGNHAIGISRQMISASNLLDRSNLEKASISSTGSGLNLKSAPDHSVCLLRKHREKWSVTDCFSVVELKMSDSNCKTFYWLKNDGYQVDLADKHGPLAQVIMYNLGCIVLHRAKRGVLGNHVPLVIIAGQRLYKSDTETHEPQKQKETVRWVSGDLFVPAACGGDYSYAIKSFGQFHNNNQQDKDRSVEQALSLYIDAFCFGLNDAIAIHRKLTYGELPLARPASGQRLMIGNKPLELQLCASPIPGASVTQDAKERSIWKVSQGEIFKGKIDLFDTLQHSGAKAVVFAPEKGKMLKDAIVLAKISSSAVHNLLINPYFAFKALNELKRSTALTKELGSVLYAVVSPNPGLITIMSDLTAQGYGNLHPIRYSGKLATLWRGFQVVVKTVLLPMAKKDVLHSDIRPGYDFTANILCKLTKDEGGVETAAMKLIDYESAVEFDAWLRGAGGAGLDGRYIKYELGWDATTVVWWQCMAVAYSWKEKLSAETLRTENGMGMMKTYLRGEESGPSWLKKYRQLATPGRKIGVRALNASLKRLAAEFEDQETQ